MRRLKNFLLVMSFLIMGITTSFSQSGYQTGRYYAYQGATTTQTDYRNVYNAWCNCWQTVKYCRQLSWYQEYREGYVYYWNYQTNSWYYKYESGYFWYCTWSGWYMCY